MTKTYKIIKPSENKQITTELEKGIVFDLTKKKISDFSVCELIRISEKYKDKKFTFKVKKSQYFRLKNKIQEERTCVKLKKVLQCLQNCFKDVSDILNDKI